MIRRNISHMLRFAPGTTFLLILSMASVVCVIITATGTLISLGHFFTDYFNTRYFVEVDEQFTSGQLEPIRSLSGDERVIMVSEADPATCAVVVGIGGKDGWMPPNRTERITGRDEDFIHLSSRQGRAYVDSNFSNLYENIELQMDEIMISGKSFEVLGMANYYFSQDEYDHVVDRTRNGAIEIESPGEQLALYATVNGNRLVYPDALGTVLISASDFIRLDLPVAYVSVIYQNPPTHDQYEQTRRRLSEVHGHMEPFRSGAGEMNLSHMILLVCVIAISIALTLARFLIAFLLDACADIWRGLFIIGCRAGRMITHMIVHFLLLYSLSAVLSFYPCRMVINWLSGINISIPISACAQIALCIGCVLLLLLTSMPTMLSAVRKYTREDGNYVPTY